MESEANLSPMEKQIVEQGACMRCYVCGSPQIAVVCHHCGRSMCPDHGPVHPLLRWFTENREFTRLTFGTWPLHNPRSAHCHEHVHSSPNYRRIMIVPGVLILLVSLWFTLTALSSTFDCLSRRPARFIPGEGNNSEVLRDPSVYDGLGTGLCYRPELNWDLWRLLQVGLVALFGATTTGLGIYLNRERIAADLSGWRPPVPMGPVSDRFEVVEVLSAHLTLNKDGRTALSALEVAEGRLYADLRFTPADRQRLEEYRQKYGMKSSEPLDYHAGFLGLAGRPRLSLADDVTLKIPATNLICLDGSVAEQAYLSGTVGASDPTCLESLAYSMELGEEKADSWCNVPVRLVPLFGETGNNRQLRLELQFNPVDFPYLQKVKVDGREEDGDYIQGQRIVLEEVQLDLDAEQFGKPVTEGLITQHTSHENGQEKIFFRVVWRGMWFQPREGITSISLPVIRFSQAIPSGARLVGRLRLRVPSLRSNLERVRYFSPLGNPVGDIERSGKPYPFQGSTVIDLTYDLALERLRRTWWLALPKGRIPTELMAGDTAVKSTSLKFPVSLDPPIVRRLLLELGGGQQPGLASEHTSLRRVVQDPPRTSERDARRNRWYWDIKGRRYKASLPIDFHLIVSGEGQADGSRHGGGFTEVEISVQGQVFEYVGLDDDTLTEKVTHNLADLENELQILEQQVKSVFSGETRPAGKP